MADNRNASAALEAALALLDGLNWAEASSVAVNLMARVAMVAARQPKEAEAVASLLHQKVTDAVEKNWPLIEEERAANGGRQPSWNR